MKILFVDGEPGAAAALAGRVADDGFAECRAATSAQEAVDIVNNEGEIDLLVTDAFLGDCDGFTLDETLRTHLPNLRTIYLSEVELSEYADRIGGAEVFGKPVDPDALTAYLKGGEVSEGDPQEAAGPQMIGVFRIDAYLGNDANGPVYTAFQTNIAREVQLHTFDPSTGGAGEFLASASLKANVRHPAVLAVFEAGEANGIPFYAAEPPQGTSLADYAAQQRHMAAADVLQLLQTVSEVMVHFSEAGISRDPLSPEQILIDHRNRARVWNMASSQPVEFSVSSELRELGAILKTVLQRMGQIGPLLQLLDEMGNEDGAVRTWNALLHEVKRRAPQSAPTRQIALDASGRAAIAAVGATRRKRRTLGVVKVIVGLVVLGALGGFAAWYFAIPLGGNLPSTMTKIPDGALEYANGKRADVPAFWVDQNEVSIEEYAEFLGWLQRPGNNVSALDYPEMPPGKSHVPDNWEEIYRMAQTGGIMNGRRIDLATPVFNVDWYDAYAYAHWKDRRLPSDLEWDRLTLEESGIPPEASKLKGLDGNVSEWTMTWVETADGKKSPVIRGGDSSALDAVRRVSDAGPLQRSPTVGFRTASDKAPLK